MSTSGSDRGDGSPLDERFLEYLPPETDPRRAAALAAFAQAYVRRAPAEELEDIPPGELFAEIEAAFRFLEARGNAPVALRVFDPDPVEHGYESPGTVVEVAIDDMPFLVDSVTNALEARGHEVMRVLHPVLGTRRDEAGRLLDVFPARDAGRRESFQHYLLERHLDAGEREELAAVLDGVLGDVRRVVRDFEPMQAAVGRMIELAREATARYSSEEIEEAVAFLTWLLDLNFVFLGYREYRIEGTGEGRTVRAVPDSGLGLLADVTSSRFAAPVPISALPAELASRYEEGDLIVVTKTNRFATVHRRARMDYVGIRHVGPDGSVLGEARLIGLFTSKAYMAEAADVPILRRKLAAILEAEDVIEGTHDYKLLVQLFDSFPKDDLFASSVPDLRRSLVGLLGMEERQHVRLFIRRDLLLRSVSLVVVLPRDVFNPELRQRLQALFLERFGGSAIDYRLSLGETGDARLHFTVWIEGHAVPDVPIEALEAEVLELARTWEDRVAEVLSLRVGEDEARRLAERWCRRFPAYYRSSIALPLVAGDILGLERLVSGKARVLVGLQNESGEGERLTRVAVYRLDGKLDLSAMLPVLEDLGLRVVEEVPTRLLGDDGETFIHDFGVLGPDGAPLDVARCGGRVAEAIVAVLEGRAESDSLNRLVVSSGLDHDQVGVLRAYRTYWRLVTPAFSVRYVDDAFAAHPEIAHNLVRLFAARFGPDGDEGQEAAVRADILHDLEGVASLDEDRILRAFVGLVDATVRTNAFLAERSCLSFKLRSDRVPEMPEPRPRYEIFVYAPDVEGIHLRGGPVARGGIRWSTRREDYRTEVLGLMKAQMTKNAVIVPTGAKGGFVLRSGPRGGPTPELVERAYATFIRGLLDLTDNLVGGEVRHPPGVRLHDGPDPYLVVAADRGTARFSDTANAIAAEYGYWLGDAFASGGSAGYDHKALGITARGAWESVRRHFLELGVDVDAEEITVVGIGDMSGDVFGNGMLRSRKLRLVAAFDHRHVFIDPDPDPEVAYRERERLAALAASSWAEYERSLLSAGGGVWPRGAKHIELSAEARRALGTDLTGGTPAEVIQAILRAPVDLLWNGGIGTYVKASDEPNEAVQDRANDAVRVNGRELRCRVVGEGGNLGFTQRGRIEYDRHGGRIFTDFIDNSAGVHTSDREVNLKILLGLAVERGEIDRRERDAIVASVAGAVTEKVVLSNFLQAQILAQEAARSATQIDAYEDLMVQLEDEGLLDRTLEDLPGTEEMTERLRTRIGMARPELAVLLAYAKRSLTAALLASDLPDAPAFAADLRDYFPAAVSERLGDLVQEHPLRRELVATIVANEIVDSEGITFVSRLQAETGAEPARIARAYRLARGITDALERWRAIEALGISVPADVVRTLLDGVDTLVESVTRWYLVRGDGRAFGEDVAETRAAFTTLADRIAAVGPEEWRREREEIAAGLVDAGVPPAIARRHAYQPELVHAPDIIDVARRAGRPVEDVARAFFRVGRAFRIDWLEEELGRLPAVTRWQRYAVQALEDDLLLLRRELAERALADAGTVPADEAVDRYVARHGSGERRLLRFMRMLARDGITDAAGVVVAIRQVRTLVG